MSLFNELVSRGLGVDPSLISGATGYATASRSLDLLTGKVSRDEYVRWKLAHEMTQHRGRKRLRKKKAVAALRRRWGFLQMGRAISRRVDYSEVGRKLFQVEPLPMGTLPFYDKTPDVAAWVTSSPEEGEE